MKQEVSKARYVRRLSIYGLTAILLLALGAALLIALQELILPTIVGAFAAYVCRPLMGLLTRKGLDHHLAILVLFVLFGGLMMVVSDQVQSNMPDEMGKLELRTRIQYKATQRFNQAMGLEEDPKKGNFLYQTLGQDLQQAFDNFANSVMFNPSERILFELHAINAKADSAKMEVYYNYYLENIRNDQQRLGKNFIKEKSQEKADEAAQAAEGGGESRLAAIKHTLSLWLTTPFVFLFLLVDEGQIKKSLVSVVPNQYFEMILTMFDNVDLAIGNYLRGTLMECGLVGLSFGACLYLIGMDFQIALVIGLISGVVNAIPFLGPMIGAVLGAGYALIAEDISPLIPMVTLDSLVFWVIIAVLVVHVLDNVIFQPVVLGSAVSLHPLVVIIGIMGGGVLMGVVGMLFAIPAIVIFKVIFATFFDQMKAYHII